MFSGIVGNYDILLLSAHQQSDTTDGIGCNMTEIDHCTAFIFHEDSHLITRLILCTHIIGDGETEISRKWRIECLGDIQQVWRLEGAHFAIHNKIPVTSPKERTTTCCIIVANIQDAIRLIQAFIVRQEQIQYRTQQSTQYKNTKQIYKQTKISLHTPHKQQCNKKQ